MPRAKDSMIPFLHYQRPLLHQPWFLQPTWAPQIQASCIPAFRDRQKQVRPSWQMMGGVQDVWERPHLQNNRVRLVSKRLKEGGI